jgi:hypothetical protein
MIFQLLTRLATAGVAAYIVAYAPLSTARLNFGVVVVLLLLVFADLFDLAPSGASGKEG